MSNTKVNIQNESTEFLRLQALGNCSSKCKKRLTKLSLTVSKRELFRKLYVVFGDMYFGINPFSTNQNIDLTAIEQALNNIRYKVSQCEQDLVDYIWMIVHGIKDNAAKIRLENHYNSLIHKDI